METPVEGIEAAERDLLDSAEAGGRAIRGGAIRSLGYFVGLALALISAPLLTRHLGVANFGRWVVVGSLIAIVAIVADAGLTTVGVREYAVRDAAGRQRLMRNLVAVRLVVAVVGAAGAVLFAVAAGYDNVLVAGTALGGLGLLFTMAQHTYVIPLTAELQLGRATALDLLRQALTVIGIVALVISGAGLLAFFVLPVPIGIVVLLTTLVVVRGHRSVRPRFDREEWRYLLVETIPAAAASVLASLFYRVAIVMMSVITIAAETGYFSASFRVIEAFVAVPSFVVGSAYPVLSRAADTDRDRLAYGFERLFQVARPAASPSASSALEADHRLRRRLRVRPGGAGAPAPGPRTRCDVPRGPLRRHALGRPGEAKARDRKPVRRGRGDRADGRARAVLGGKGRRGRDDLRGDPAGGLARNRPPPRAASRAAPEPVGRAEVLVALAAASALALTPLPSVLVVVIGSAVYFAVLLLLRAVPVEIWHAIVHRRGQDVLEPPSR